jgi:hypothetical protein
MLAKMANIVLQADEKEYAKVNAPQQENTMFFFSQPNNLFLRIHIDAHGYACVEFSKGRYFLHDKNPIHYLSLKDPFAFRFFKKLVNDTY